MIFKCLALFFFVFRKKCAFHFNILGAFYINLSVKQNQLELLWAYQVLQAVA